MLYSPYDDDSDDVADQDDAPIDAMQTQDDDSDDAPAGDPTAGLPDVTVGGYDLSADPAMMDDILNGSGTWPDGGASDNPIYLPASSGPVSKVMPVVPSDGAAGAAPGPAIVPTLADTGGGSGPATYVPIVASLGAGLGSLSDSVGGKVVPVVAGEGGAAISAPIAEGLSAAAAHSVMQIVPADHAGDVA